jgi:hypothetical protein
MVLGSTNLDNLGTFGLVVFAFVSALVYYMLKNVTTNKFVIIAIGLALMLFTTGSLQTVGLGVTALGVSRLIEQDITKLESS